MTALTLYYHPLASFCHKVLIALYENQTAFEGVIVDLADAASSAELFAFWPVGKIPVLRDHVRQQTVPETSIIIEYVARHYPGPVAFVPDELDGALEVRLWDRFFDCYVMAPMQKIVTDRLRAPGENDGAGVREAERTLRLAYDMAERHFEGRTWAAGATFSMADCAAAPALFYAGIALDFTGTHPRLSAYFERLLGRASFARVLDEARPYFTSFPLRERMPARFL